MGVKWSRCLGLTTLPLSCVDCREIWDPPAPWTLRACADLYRDCFVSAQLFPLLTFTHRQLFFLENIKQVILIYLTLITLITLRESLCSARFTLFYSLQDDSKYFFQLSTVHLCFQFRLRHQVPYPQNYTKFLTIIAMKMYPKKEI
jgi:hypothetical protein